MQHNHLHKWIIIILSATFGFFLFSQSVSKTTIMKKIIRTENAPSPIGPYSQAVKSGSTLYLSGQIAINPETGLLADGGIAAETRQVLNNLKAVLIAAGMDMDHVVKCTIFLSDMDEFPEMNKVYGEFFPDEPPARECVQVARLPKNVHVEISAIAVD